jgi:hypothetical protein
VRRLRKAGTVIGVRLVEVRQHRVPVRIVGHAVQIAGQPPASDYLSCYLILIDMVRWR